MTAPYKCAKCCTGRDLGKGHYPMVRVSRSLLRAMLISLFVLFLFFFFATIVRNWECCI